MMVLLLGWISTQSGTSSPSKDRREYENETSFWVLQVKYRILFIDIPCLYHNTITPPKMKHVALL